MFCLQQPQPAQRGHAALREVGDWKQPGWDGPHAEARTEEPELGAPLALWGPEWVLAGR